MEALRKFSQTDVQGSTTHRPSQLCKIMARVSQDVASVTGRGLKPHFDPSQHSWKR